MIVVHNKAVQAVVDAPFRCHLVGSRFVGKCHQETSDYDYYVEIEEGFTGFAAFEAWANANGFVRSTKGYGDDGRLEGGSGYVSTSHGDAPHVDLFPMTPKEAAWRLRWMCAMAKVGEISGLIARGLKSEPVWGVFWAVLAEFEKTKAKESP